jgi:hypothetical protein
MLVKLNIPFQITGGLAAIFYGVKRSLADIDIDIPENYFPVIEAHVKDYIIYGPSQFQDETWDLMLMTLSYHGQLIDLSGAFYTKIFSKRTQKWQAAPTDFSKIETIQCFDLLVPVIAKKELIFYKKILSRPVDLIDIEKMGRRA